MCRTIEPSNHIATIEYSFYDVNYVNLDDIENILQTNKIPYNKRWDAVGEYSVESEKFRIDADSNTIIKECETNTEGPTKHLRGAIMSNKSFYTIAYKELRESKKGMILIEQSESDAAKSLFRLESGDKNYGVASKLSAKTIYDAVTLSSSLSIEVDGEHYTLEPYYPTISEDTVLEILRDFQAAIEHSLLSAALMNDEGYHKEIFPSATKMEVLDVCMLDVVGDYNVPTEIPEWNWIEETGSYAHHRNGQDGIWEFVVNVSLIENVPEKLKGVIAAANKTGASYILFHQGT